MNAGVGAYVCAFFDDYMTRKRRRIRHDHVVANQAIVSNMCLGHQKAIIADAGDASSAFCPAVDRYKFANPCASANFSFSCLAREFKILGRQPNRHKRKNVSFLTDSRATINYAVAVDSHAITQRDFVADDSVGTDVTASADLCCWTNNRCGMYLRRRIHAGTSLNGRGTHGDVVLRSAITLISSASAQSWPSTLASPRIR